MTISRTMTGALVCALLALSSACGSEGPPSDRADAATDGARMDAGRGPCESDVECDDGRWCNGAETCESGVCVAGVARCTGACDEGERTCGGGCADLDGDGAEDEACGGDDCDDTNPNRAPDRTEICDAIDRDEDCDPETFGVRDEDGDGVPDALCCNEAEDGTRTCGTDCDDTDPTVLPRGVEVCDSQDNDCDGAVDEGAAPATWYRDADGDGRGDDASTMVSCVPPGGHVLVGGDCDDTTASRRPGLGESCDGLDNDCNDVIDDGEIPGIGDDCTTTEVGACSRGVVQCMGSSGPQCVRRSGPVAERCNAIDDDCDGSVDDGITEVGASCSVPGALGVCAAGRQVCDGAAGLRCQSTTAPSSEQCSAADEDCDGNAFNGFTCATGTSRACSACGGGFTGTQTCGAGCSYEALCNAAPFYARWLGSDSRFTFPGTCSTTSPSCVNYNGRVRTCGETYSFCSSGCGTEYCSCWGQRCVFTNLYVQGPFDGYASPTARICAAGFGGFNFQHPNGAYYCMAGGSFTLPPAEYRARIRYRAVWDGYSASIAPGTPVLEVHDLTAGLVRSIGTSAGTTGADEVEVRFTHPTGSCATYELRVPLPSTGGGNFGLIAVEWVEIERLSAIRLPAP